MDSFIQQTFTEHHSVPRTTLGAGRPKSLPSAESSWEACPPAMTTEWPRWADGGVKEPHCQPGIREGVLGEDALQLKREDWGVFSPHIKPRSRIPGVPPSVPPYQDEFGELLVIRLLRHEAQVNQGKIPWNEAGQLGKGGNSRALLTIQRSFDFVLQCFSSSRDPYKTFYFVFVSMIIFISSNKMAGIVVKTYSRSSGQPCATQLQWPQLCSLLRWHLAREAPAGGQRRCHLHEELTLAEIKDSGGKTGSPHGMGWWVQQNIWK